jgi:hypothetical protein
LPAGKLYRQPRHVGAEESNVVVDWFGKSEPATSRCERGRIMNSGFDHDKMGHWFSFLVL